MKQKGKPHKWEYQNPILNLDFFLIDRIIRWPDERDVRLEIAIDVTSVKEAERELQLYKTNLEELVKVRTQELNNIIDELESFSYSVSHDLRAPLRGIMSFAAFLDEDYRDKLGDEGKDQLKEIQTGAARMNQLIDDLLTLSRISRIKNPFENVDMASLIDSVINRISFDIKEKNVDLVIEKNIPMIFCDRIKMGEVFLNLVNNAIKFSSKNNKERPKVEIGYVQEEGFHKFYVKDNGIGIAPQYHQQIFGIFRRLHTSNEYEGTGAGLSIVKRVIEEHGGNIWVESEPGKGAVFYFTIPKNLNNGILATKT